MADAVLGYVVEQVGDLLKNEGKFLFSVRDEVEWVRTELRAMECFLSYADVESRTADERVKNWVREVREIVYQAEDLVESFHVDAERRQLRRKGFLRTTVSLPSKFIARRRFGKEIENIKGKIGCIKERRITYGIPDLGKELGRQTDNEVRERRQVLGVSDPDLVGMDEEKMRILGDLLDGSRKKRSVISIVGMGGLGKSTLAKRVFNAARVHFSHSVWVDVSKEYSAVDLLRKILLGFTGLGEMKLERMTNDDCVACLDQTLQVGKHLIVMDDVWDTAVWGNLSKCLPEAENGSRVLITTRSLDVARAADTSTPPLELRLLSAEESWELLSKKAFPNQKNIEAACSEELRKAGKGMAMKCGGLPLALVVLGGLLSMKPRSLGEWRRLEKTIVWEDIKEGRLCLKILALSYHDLCLRLKYCFLYFSSLPQGFKIEDDKLIRLWIAEGFVAETKGKTLEETANGYLEELVQRCLVIVVRDVGFNQYIQSKIWSNIGIHDMLHEFTIQEAMGVDFHIRRSTEEYSGGSQLDFSVRRLSLQGKVPGRWSFALESTPRLKTVLSFITFENRDRMITCPIQDLKVLRVVDLENVPIAKLPEQVGDLIHLRYLGLKGTGIKGLPSSVGKLSHLQCLEVSGTDIATMPKGIWKIKALRQVIVPPRLVPEMVDTRLINLQVLKEVQAGSWIDGCLGSLTNLRALEIVHIKDCHHPALSSCLPRLPHLEKLSLEGALIPDCVWIPSGFSSLKFLCLDGRVTRPQQSNSSGDQWLPYLTKLILYHTSLDQDSIVVIENLRELTDLYLGEQSYVGNEMICSRGGFLKLESLVLHSLVELERWVLEAGAMPCLRSLKIDHCTNLAMLLEGLQHMATLENFALWGM